MSNAKNVALYNVVQGKTTETIVAEYAPLVKRIAHHLMGRLPASVLVDDLIQAGMIGLIEASTKFDPSKGASFETYAGIRIRGSMLDEVRKGDWVPRSVHRHAREMTAAIRVVENKKGRFARTQEIADEMGLSLSEYYKIARDTSCCRLFGFDDVGMDDSSIAEVTDEPTGPFQDIQSHHFKEMLALQIEKLPERERLILALYYQKELNLKEIGLVLGVSESRISQIHSQAMLRLKARMKDWHSGAA